MSTTYTTLTDTDGKEYTIWIAVIEDEDVIAVSDDTYTVWTDYSYTYPS